MSTFEYTGRHHTSTFCVSAQDLMLATELRCSCSLVRSSRMNKTYVTSKSLSRSCGQPFDLDRTFSKGTTTRITRQSLTVATPREYRDLATVSRGRNVGLSWKENFRFFATREHESSGSIRICLRFASHAMIYALEARLCDGYFAEASLHGVAKTNSFCLRRQHQSYAICNHHFLQLAVSSELVEIRFAYYVLI